MYYSRNMNIILRTTLRKYQSIKFLDKKNYTNQQNKLNLMINLIFLRKPGIHSPGTGIRQQAHKYKLNYRPFP
jgi:hypothetical protein